MLFGIKFYQRTLITQSTRILLISLISFGFNALMASQVVLKRMAISESVSP